MIAKQLVDLRPPWNHPRKPIHVRLWLNMHGVAELLICKQWKRQVWVSKWVHQHMFCNLWKCTVVGIVACCLLLAYGCRYAALNANQLDITRVDRHHGWWMLVLQKHCLQQALNDL